jgi:tetratricopeptide (TPR) repeat protein
MLTGIRCVSITGCMLGLTVSFPTPAQPIDDARLEQLGTLIETGRCDLLDAELARFGKQRETHPDLLAFDANCRLRAARKIEEHFDTDRYQRWLIGSGLATLPASWTTELAGRRLVVDPKALDTALALFSRALVAAPKRADIIAGNIAVRIANGKAEQAIDLIKTHRRAIDEPILGDVSRAVEDALAVGDLATAETVVRYLEREFKNSYAVHAAAASLAAARSERSIELEQLSAMSRLESTDVALARRAAMSAMMLRNWSSAINLLVPHANTDLDTQALLGLCRAAQALGSSKSIWVSLQAALEKNTNVDPATRAVVEHYLRITSSTSPPTAVMRLRGGRLLLTKGLILPALVEIDSALQLDASLIEARIALVQAYRQQRAFTEALAALDQASQALGTAAPGSVAYTPAELSATRCALLFGLKRDREALAACEAARGGGHSDYLTEAQVLVSLGRTADAIAALEAAVKSGGELGARAQSQLEALRTP